MQWSKKIEAHDCIHSHLISCHSSILLPHVFLLDALEISHIGMHLTQTIFISCVDIFVGCAMNFHDVRLHNKTIGSVVDSNKVRFMKSNVSLRGKVVLCAGVGIPPDSVGRMRLEPSSPH